MDSIQMAITHKDGRPVTTEAEARAILSEITSGEEFCREQFGRIEEVDPEQGIWLVETPDIWIEPLEEDGWIEEIGRLGSFTAEMP